MLNNIFSSFDRKNFILLSYIFLNIFFFKLFPNFFYLRKIKIFLNEIKNLIYYNINKNSFFLIIFILIFFLNLFSLNIYIFNVTRQIRFNLIIIFRLWLPILIISITKKNNFFLIHLLPIGTSSLLIPIIILIELLRFFIRPLTLFLRLSINIIAGHVLVNLIRINILDNRIIYILILYAYIIIKFLVRFIQSYIINTLLNLYIEEIYVKYKFFFY